MLTRITPCEIDLNFQLANLAYVAVKTAKLVPTTSTPDQTHPPHMYTGYQQLVDDDLVRLFVAQNYQLSTSIQEPSLPSFSVYATKNYGRGLKELGYDFISQINERIQKSTVDETASTLTRLNLDQLRGHCVGSWLVFDDLDEKLLQLFSVPKLKILNLVTMSSMLPRELTFSQALLEKYYQAQVLIRSNTMKVADGYTFPTTIAETTTVATATVNSDLLSDSEQYSTTTDELTTPDITTANTAPDAAIAFIQAVTTSGTDQQAQEATAQAYTVARQQQRQYNQQLATTNVATVDFAQAFADAVTHARALPTEATNATETMEALDVVTTQVTNATSNVASPAINNTEADSSVNIATATVTTDELVKFVPVINRDSANDDYLLYQVTLSPEQVQADVLTPTELLVHKYQVLELAYQQQLQQARASLGRIPWKFDWASFISPAQLTTSLQQLPLAEYGYRKYRNDPVGATTLTHELLAEVITKPTIVEVTDFSRSSLFGVLDKDSAHGKSVPQLGLLALPNVILAVTAKDLARDPKFTHEFLTAVTEGYFQLKQLETSKKATPIVGLEITINTKLIVLSSFPYDDCIFQNTINLNNFVEAQNQAITKTEMFKELAPKFRETFLKAQLETLLGVGYEYTPTQSQLGARFLATRPYLVPITVKNSYFSSKYHEQQLPYQLSTATNIETESNNEALTTNEDLNETDQVVALLNPEVTFSIVDGNQDEVTVSNSNDPLVSVAIATFTSNQQATPAVKSSKIKLDSVIDINKVYLHQEYLAKVLPSHIANMEQATATDKTVNPAKLDQVNLNCDDNDVLLGIPHFLTLHPECLETQTILDEDDQTCATQELFVDKLAAPLEKVVADYFELVMQLATMVRLLGYDHNHYPLSFSYLNRLLMLLMRNGESIDEIYWAPVFLERYISRSRGDVILLDELIKQDHGFNDLMYQNDLNSILQGYIQISTDNQLAPPGQINGLGWTEALGADKEPIGSVFRLSCVVNTEHGQLLDVDSEIDYAGGLAERSHILTSAYLKSLFKETVQFSGSIVTEQLYEQIDGDSGSLASFCALASALANVRMKQYLAVTGSVDQYGNVLAVGGLNQKIEAFYNLCAKREEKDVNWYDCLERDYIPGVIIPATNVMNLQLSDDVLLAIQDNRFAIYTVNHVSEALELLTEQPFIIPELDQKDSYQAAEYRSSWLKFKQYQVSILHAIYMRLHADDDKDELTFWDKVKGLFRKAKPRVQK